ncbi:MAG: anthranilate synthase component I [Micrococcaceae bacterium]
MRDLGTVHPSRTEFQGLSSQHTVIPVTMTVLADAITPVGLYRRLANDRPGTFLMESAAQGGVWSRYSFVGAGSAATLTELDGQAIWQGTPPAGVPATGDPLDVLDATLRFLASDARNAVAPDLPNLVSGLAGFLGWETIRHWEKLPEPPPKDLNLPLLAMNLITDLAIHDQVDGTVTLVANAINLNGLESGAERAYDDAVARLQSMAERLAAGAHDPVSVAPAAWLDIEVTSRVQDAWTEQSFLDAIDDAHRAIVDGEIFQIVLSRRFAVDTDASGLDVYRVLRAMNPSPYMYLFTFDRPDGSGPFQIVGSSPEALVTVNDGHVVTHPIAGSRPRGASVEDDRLAEKDLLHDDKERAEHLMLVDLSRNDLSKVCTPGTVRVTQFMEVERFSHIMHLVSHVEGTMEHGRTALDVLGATFPAGTLSGAPKPRALQLLEQWEPQQRGAYAGVIGYFDLAGNMDMAINIRSATLVDGTAYVQAGAGIVADSDPQSEAAETVAKASAPMRAVLAATSLSTLQDTVPPQTPGDA